MKLPHPEPLNPAKPSSLNMEQGVGLREQHTLAPWAGGGGHGLGGGTLHQEDLQASHVPHSAKGSLQFGGFSFGEKGLDLKILGGNNPDNRDIQYIPIPLLITRGPRASMTQECIPIQFVLELQEPPIIPLIWRPPFLILAGQEEPPQTVEVLRLITSLYVETYICLHVSPKALNVVLFIVEVL